MAIMSLVEYKKLIQGETVQQKKQPIMSIDEYNSLFGREQTAGGNTPAVSVTQPVASVKQPAASFEKPVAETVDVNKKYGLVDGKVVLPSHIENQGLYAAPGTEKSKVNYLMDSAAKGLAGGIVTAGEAVAQDLMGEGGKASREFYDYAMESAYNPQVAGQMDEYLKAKQDAEKNEKLRTDTLGYKLLESSDADMAKAQEGMGAVGQFMTGVVGSALQNAYLAPLAVINPGIASAMMALSAAGRTAKEKSDEGNTLKQAMVRGAIDGTIEYFTEKLPMESLAKRLTGEGDDIVKFVLQQVASEAGEEGVSYAAGVMADILSKNPDAQFSVQDLALNMLAGGMAGGLLAGGGIAVGATVNTLKTAQQPTVDATQTEANLVPKQPVGVKEYVDTLKESAKGNAQNNLNGEYKKTGMTAAEYVEKNLDGNFYQEKNKLYFMEKDGTKVPVSKTVHDYAKYLQANRPQTATVNQTADAGNVAQITGPQNVQQTTPVQQASQTVEQQTVKDINVPGTNAVNTAPTETAKEETERIITTESNPARKALHRKKLVDMGKEGVAKYLDDFEKRTGIQVYLFDGSDYSWGFQKGKAIYLNIESPDIVLKTKVHESVHVYKKNNEKKFKFLRKNALKLEDYSRPNRFGRAAADVRETYADDPDVDEEVVARLCELCLDDTEAFLDKVNRDKTIIEAVVDILKYIKNTLTTILSKDGLKVEQAKIDNTLFALERLLRSDVGEIREFADADIKFSIRESDPPKKTVKGYKVFVVKDGKLYPPMVANTNATATPVGVWLDADIGGIAYDENGSPILNNNGRIQVKAGGKGTQGGSGTLAFRPGWHLGEYPDASQFGRLNRERTITDKKGNQVHPRELFPYNFVWAECDVSADVDYQLDAIALGVTEKGNFNRTQAGLPYVPVDGYYKYRTNANPDTAPWLIAGAIKVNKILTDDEVAQICAKHGVTPQKRAGYEVKRNKSGEISSIKELNKPGNKIDLSMFGLESGDVTPSGDDVINASRRSPEAKKKHEDTMSLIKTLPGYRKRQIDFSNPAIENEFAMNNQDINYYRSKAEGSGHSYLKDDKLYNDGIHFSKKTDERYLQLAQNPEANEAELQKMVEAAAKEAGYNYKAFHGTVAGDFTVFDIGKTSNVNDIGKGHYFTTNTKEAEKYAGKDGGNEDNEAKIEARIYEKWEELGYTEDDLYDNEYVDEYNRIYDEVVAEFEENSRVVPAYLKLENPYIINSVSDSYGIDSQQLIDKGYDGIIDNTVSQRFGSPEGTQHIIVFDSNQIKSADTVTYDNDGNIIPLEERFNTKNPDIRFSKKVDEQVKKEYNNSRKNKETEDETVYGRRNERTAERISTPGRSGHPVHKDNQIEKQETLERSGGRNEQLGERKPRWFRNTRVSYVPASYSELNDNAKEFVNECKKHGFGCFGFKGKAYGKDYSIGEEGTLEPNEAATVDLGKFFVGNKLDTEGKEAFAHELIHQMIKIGEVEDGDYYNIATSNLNKKRKAYAFMKETLLKKGYEEVKVDEEIIAHFSGWLYNSNYGNNSEFSKKMIARYASVFNNFEAVKNAHKRMVEQVLPKAIPAEPYNDNKSVGIDGIKYSLKSARHDFIDDGQILNDLVNYEIFTPKQAEKFQKNIEKVLNTVLANPRALDMNEEYTKDNRPYNSFKPNSDPLYKISLDFSTMCKKRLMTQYLIESLQTKLAETDPDTKAISAEETLAIRERLLQLKEEYKDIEVACGLCYVEAARLKGPKQINAFLDKAGREKMMRKYFAKQNEEFNKEIEDLKVWMKRQEGYGADVPISHLPQKLKNRINNTVKRRRERYTPTVEEQKIIDRALKMDNIQFLTVDNLTRMSVNEPEIYKAFTEQVRNSTRSKTVESGVPYYYGDSTAQKLTDKLIEAMNKENGLRHQSWSDFETVHLLDTITAICELSIRGAKMHAYTKVPNFIRLVGDTGMMINISLIPEGETGIENGKLVYSSVEGMDYETAKQLRDEHPATTGTICIGINDKQIVMMLNDGTIDYVIPYHASGMNKKLRGMAKVSGWTNYQDKQTEKYIAGATNKDNNPDWHRKPDFSEWFTPSEEDIANKDGVTIMREAAERYKQLCAERGLHPKFNDFVKEDNYWKLLIDRKMVDHKTGKIIIQDKVRPNFNFDVIDAILDEEVKKYDSDLKATLVDKLLESWNDGTIKAIENKLVANEKANTAKRNALAKNKLTAQDAMAVMSALGEGVVLDKDNIIDNSVYGKLLRFDAKMSRKSKRTAIPEEYIGKSVSEVKQLIADKHKAKSTTVNAVGATKANPKNITHMVNEYGEMKPGEKPERFISMPVSTDGNDRVGKFARTAAEAGVTSEKMVQAIEKAVARGDFSHEIWRDKTAIDDAVKYIEKYGYEATLKEFYKRVDNKGQITKGDMTKALTMYAVAVENDNLETALKLAVKINKAAVNAGQVVQSVRILKKSSPEGRLYFAQKSLEAYQDEVNEKYGSKAPKLVVEDSILKALKDARTEEEIEKATTELHQVIADQLPFSWSNFITSWRYLAMLGNPRTQVRNVISNAVNSVASEYVNWIQAGIEKSTGAAKSTTAQKPTQAQLDYAEKDYKIIRKQLSGEDKYKDNSLNSIERMKNPFSFPTFWGKEGDQFVGWKGNVRKYGEPLMKVLTKWNEATNYAMEKGDLIFSEKAYKKALARYLKANNIDPAKITAKQLTDARAWATRQALESVFRENNQLANRISRLERNLVNSNSKAGKAGAVFIGGLMPFKSTPLNITKRAFEYTPLGIIKGIADIKTNEKVYMPAAINDIAKGLSGTSLIILGAALAKYGLLKGGLGDDKEDKMKKQMGQQSYSIDTPWFSYTLDWGGAALMPLFVGADIYESNSEDDSWLMNIVNALANAGSPIIETSMMTGMMDAIQSMSYEDVATEKLVAGLSSAMANYLGQFVPTLFGQVARAVDDTSRSSYTDVKGALKPLAKTAQKAQNKIPFLSKTNVPYMDVWGNEEKNFGGNVVGRLAYNMLSPGYVSTKSNDKVEKMLTDLYDKTGEKSVLPSNYTTYKRMGDETIRFTDKQYEAYTKAYGQTAYDILNDLSSDKGFNSMEDAYKAEVIAKAYKYSTAIASNDVVDKELTARQANQQKAMAKGLSAYEVFGGLIEADGMGKDGNANGTLSKSEVTAYIESRPGLRKTEKAYLFAALGNSNWINPYI